jgi:deoxycytidylate deaminase
MEIEVCYTTTFPCVTCFKLLANTTCRRIFYDEPYESHQNAVEALNAKLQCPMEIIKYVADATKLVHPGGNLATLIHSVIAGFEK